MSGIAGIYRFEGRPVDRNHLGRMLESLAHRGAESSKVWSRASLGLGHRAMPTTPESLLERGPLVDATRDLVLTADLRIDNRNELLDLLDLRDGRPQEVTDGQLVLAAYDKWGESCPQNLLGDFAFAIWDGRRQVLFCARDHFGVKPFYYFSSSRAFIFASEIKGLLCLHEVPCSLNELRIGDYLVPTLEDKASTFYQDIFRLPPAHCMTVSDNVVRINSYWSLSPSRELRLGSDREYADAFRELFTNAVQCRLRSAFPVGSTLSGGLDSSSVTCTADKLLAADGSLPLHTFSAIFPGLPEEDLSKIDERSHMDAVLAKTNTRPHYVMADQLSPFTDIDRVLQCEDEAFVAPNLYLNWGLYSAAQNQGVRVVLDGFGGDSVVSHGTCYLAELVHRGNWLGFVNEVGALSRQFEVPAAHYLRHYAFPHLTELARSGKWFRFSRDVNEVFSHFRVSRSDLWFGCGFRPLVPEFLRRLRRALRGLRKPGSDTTHTINPNFARRIGLERRITKLEGAKSRFARTAREEHCTELSSGIIPLILEEIDRIAAAFCVEPRYPFLDRRLVEFCLSLPPEQKLHQGWNRIVMRRAMDSILPREIAWRKDKANLSPNFTNGLVNRDRPILEEVILADPSNIEPYVDLSALRKAYDRWLCRRSMVDELVVWRATTLSLWLRQFDRSLCNQNCL